MSNVVKPMTAEEEYFARENAERLRKIAAEQKQKLAADELEALKKQHWMKCPKCGFDLQTIQFRGQNIDKCMHCGGTFLDAGELELLAKAEDKHVVMESLMNLFSHSKK
ncbi:MAG: zf-TFIIB domain-containing protein [Deltaproteobacteria bacterium]|nr:zf-TFIIB domain-containing protein [Deltaproteobacteria bacterium]